MAVQFKIPKLSSEAANTLIRKSAETTGTADDSRQSDINIFAHVQRVYCTHAHISFVAFTSGFESRLPTSELPTRPQPASLSFSQS